MTGDSQRLKMTIDKIVDMREHQISKKIFLIENQLLNVFLLKIFPKN
jgi:hypothetical protein